MHILQPMDEGTLTDTNPLMSSLLVTLFGVVKQFVGSKSGQKQSVKLLQNMVYSIYSTIQHPPPPHPPPPPPPHSNTLSVYTVHLVWEGGEVREKVEGQQYTSIVPSSMGTTVSQVGSKIPTNE